MLIIILNFNWIVTIFRGPVASNYGCVKHGDRLCARKGYFFR